MTFKCLFVIAGKTFFYSSHTLHVSTVFTAKPRTWVATIQSFLALLSACCSYGVGATSHFQRMVTSTVNTFEYLLLAFEQITVFGTFTRTFMSARQIFDAAICTNDLGNIFRAWKIHFVKSTGQKFRNYHSTFETRAVLTTFSWTRVFAWKTAFTRNFTKCLLLFI